MAQCSAAGGEVAGSSERPIRRVRHLSFSVTEFTPGDPCRRPDTSPISALPPQWALRCNYTAYRPGVRDTNSTKIRSMEVSVEVLWTYVGGGRMKRGLLGLAEAVGDEG